MAVKWTEIVQTEFKNAWKSWNMLKAFYAFYARIHEIKQYILKKRDKTE